MQFPLNILGSKVPPAFAIFSSPSFGGGSRESVFLPLILYLSNDWLFFYTGPHPVRFFKFWSRILSYSIPSAHSYPSGKTITLFLAIISFNLLFLSWGVILSYIFRPVWYLSFTIISKFWNIKAACSFALYSLAKAKFSWKPGELSWLEESSFMSSP